VVPEREVAGLFLILGRSVQPAPAGQRRLQGTSINKVNKHHNSKMNIPVGTVGILLFSSLTFKTPTKKAKKIILLKSFSAYYFLKVP
jgi:hypothetical protein